MLSLFTRIFCFILKSSKNDAVMFSWKVLAYVSRERFCFIHLIDHSVLFSKSSIPLSVRMNFLGGRHIVYVLLWKIKSMWSAWVQTTECHLAPRGGMAAVLHGYRLHIISSKTYYVLIYENDGFLSFGSKVKNMIYRS